MSKLPDGFEVLFNRGTRSVADYATCPKCLGEATAVSLPQFGSETAYYRCDNGCRCKWHRFTRTQPHKRAAVERYWEGRE
jgi:hypothetical protein